jgi:hypothetical protein
VADVPACPLSSSFAGLSDIDAVAVASGTFATAMVVVRAKNQGPFVERLSEPLSGSTRHHSLGHECNHYASCPNRKAIFSTLREFKTSIRGQRHYSTTKRE